MTLYRHILFAADLVFADDDLIMKKIKSLQEINQCTLSIVHAIEYPRALREGYDIPTAADWQAELESSIHERMEKISVEMHIPKEHQYIRVGKPRLKILEVASEIGADLIVVGTHARHGFRLLFSGSTANDLIRKSGCDILVIRV